MTLLVVGAEALLARLAAKAVAGEVALSQAQDILGELVALEAKRIVHVSDEPPHIRDSITYDSTEKKVYTDVVYARQLEYGGTHNKEPDPFMRPAADTVNDVAALATAKAVMDSA